MKLKIYFLAFSLFVIFAIISCNKKTIDETSDNENKIAANETAKDGVATNDTKEDVYIESGYSESHTFWTERPASFNFGNDVFDVSIIPNHEVNNVKSFVYNNDYDITFDLSIFAEDLWITKLSEKTYAFEFTSPDNEKEFYIFDTETKNLEKLFFDMQQTVDIILIDYENKAILGSTKRTSREQSISLYLFSTATQSHHKIAETTDEDFRIEPLYNGKFKYKNSEGKVNVSVSYKK